MDEEDWISKCGAKQAYRVSKNDDSTLYHYSTYSKNIIKKFSDISNIGTKTLIELNNFKISYDHEFEELTAVFDTKLSNENLDSKKIPEYIINEMNTYKANLKIQQEKSKELDVIERLNRPKTPKARSRSPLRIQNSFSPKNVNKISRSPSIKSTKSHSAQNGKEDLSVKVDKALSTRSTMFKSLQKGNAESSNEHNSNEAANTTKANTHISNIVRKQSISGLEAAPSGYLKNKTAKASSYFKPLPSGSISMSNKHLVLNKDEHHLEPLKENQDTESKKVSAGNFTKTNVFDRLTSMSTVASTMRYGGARVTGKRVSPVKLKKSPIKIQAKKTTITPRRNLDAKIKGASKRDQRIESPTKGMSEVADVITGGTFSTPANIKVVDRSKSMAKGSSNKKPVATRIVKNKVNIPFEDNMENNEKENKEANDDLKRSPFKSPTKLNSVLYDLDLKDHRQRLGDKEHTDYINETLPEIISDSESESSKHEIKSKFMKDWAADSSLLSLIRSQQRDKSKDPTRIFGPIQNVGLLDKILK
ncbi:uncharacterized protein HGUI_01393 [Hanseniaspora guilliermondii]|uniref:Inner centromere protein ARK-binding domain-containing protein n=1 Tax=Hanseniaspora guilliermondii TaxID=56406 RepID=A0A1L0CLC9_9ASCO|nr:uncharacterized protein HGUI_01393 [Hanseniaspora guilliermondii]